LALKVKLFANRQGYNCWLQVTVAGQLLRHILSFYTVNQVAMVSNISTIFLTVLTILGFSMGASANKPNKCAQALMRLETPLSKIEVLLYTEKDANLLVAKILKENLRFHLLNLEAQARFYMTSDESNMSKVLKIIKEFEDAIGRYSYSVEVLSVIKEISADKKLIQTFELIEQQERKKIIAFLKVEGWLAADHKIFKKLRKYLQRSRLPNDKNERDYLANEISKYIYKVHKKVKNNEYDAEEIETGVHELRRHLRWISLYLKASESYVALNHDIKPIEKYAPLYDKLKDSPYVQFVANTYENPIIVPTTLLMAVVDYIAQLNEVKDVGLFWQTIEEVVREKRVSVDLKQLKKRLDARTKEADSVAVTNRILNEMRETKLLKIFAEYIENQI
jgi:hypothetical protein